MSCEVAPGVVRLDRTVDEVLASPTLTDEIRAAIVDEIAYIIPTGLDPELLTELRHYLRRVARSSLPGYHPIEAGAPNSHRMNKWDERAHVGGCFHQFSFFPWNQDLFDLFDLMAPIYHLKNTLSEVAPDAFLGREPSDGVTARISVQFYPRGGGGLNLHTDPVDRHQLTIPTMELTQRGQDFTTGGIYVGDARGEVVDVQAHLQLGDVLMFNAALPHGVAPIDPEVPMAWHRFEGRWMVLLAVNKLQSTTTIADSVDLG